MSQPSTSSIKPADSSWQSWLKFVRQQLDSSRISSLLATREGDQRPYMSVEIYGVKFCGLLDSGACQTVLGKSGWEKLSSLGLKIEPSGFSSV